MSQIDVHAMNRTQSVLWDVCACSGWWHTYKLRPRLGFIIPPSWPSAHLVGWVSQKNEVVWRRTKHEDTSILGSSRWIVISRLQSTSRSFVNEIQPTAFLKENLRIRCSEQKRIDDGWDVVVLPKAFSSIFFVSSTCCHEDIVGS